MANEVLNTSGEEVVEESAASTEPAPAATTSVGSDNGAAASKETASKETASEETVSEESAASEETASEESAASEEAATDAPTDRKPSDEVLEATTLMAQAASRGPEEAQAAADKLNREVLIQTIAFQLPESWITGDIHARISEIPTASLALVLSWLALNWWEGYEIGRMDTIKALKVAAEKGLGSERDKAVIAEVEREIDRERKEGVVT